MVDEFSEFEQSMNAKIKDVRGEIRDRKDRLVKEVEDFEANLGSTSEANRLKHSRGEKNLTLIYNILEQLKKQVETSHNYLSKEVTSIETRLFITKQMLGRDVESNLES